MNAVTLDEFKDWLEKNKLKTWYLGEGGGFSQGTCPDIKYFDLTFDTRDMKIFRIKTRPIEIEVYTANEYREFEGSLLDLLDKKLKESDYGK